MSVLSSIITALQQQNYYVFEGTTDQYVLVDSRYDEFVTAVETGASYDEEGIDATQDYIGEYTITVETFTTKPTMQEAWTRARQMRDDVISVVKNNTFESFDVFLDSWVRLDPFELEENEAGYNITLIYQGAE